jgi:benzaldehyde dehydrogenase (NAD)
VRAGGTHEQLYYRPTVLAGVTPAMPAFREEIFGPVAPVVVVKDVDEAVRTANATEYGLVAAIQTGSMERGLEIAERLGRVHPMAVGHRAAAGPRLPVLTRRFPLPAKTQ